MLGLKGLSIREEIARLPSKKKEEKTGDIMKKIKKQNDGETLKTFSEDYIKTASQVRRLLIQTVKI